jgi:hypothetical protein
MEHQQQQHCRFGLGLDRFHLNLIGKFIFAFPIKLFPPGGLFSNATHFANADR